MEVVLTTSLGSLVPPDPARHGTPVRRTPWWVWSLPGSHPGPCRSYMPETRAPFPAALCLSCGSLLVLILTNPSVAYSFQTTNQSFLYARAFRTSPCPLCVLPCPLSDTTPLSAIFRRHLCMQLPMSPVPNKYIFFMYYTNTQTGVEGNL